MNEKLVWFKFSPVDWAMGKIQRVPETTQIRFIRLMCVYWNKDCRLSIEDSELEIDKEHLDLLLLKKVVKNNDGYLCIDFLDEQYDSIKTTGKKNSENASKRWKNKLTNNATAMPNNATALPSHEAVMPNDADKIREEKIRKEKEENINNTAFAFECLNSHQWRDTISMQQKIKPDLMAKVLKDFEAHLISIGSQKKDVSEFKSHFSNWIPKQDYSKKLNGTPATNNPVL